MRLLLFGLLCLLTLLLVRWWGSRLRRVASGRDRSHPAASPDEIVDVSFEERDAERETSDPAHGRRP